MDAATSSENAKPRVERKDDKLGLFYDAIVLRNAENAEIADGKKKKVKRIADIEASERKPCVPAPREERGPFAPKKWSPGATEAALELSRIALKKRSKKRLKDDPVKYAAYKAEKERQRRARLKAALANGEAVMNVDYQRMAFLEACAMAVAEDPAFKNAVLAKLIPVFPDKGGLPSRIMRTARKIAENPKIMNRVPIPNSSESGEPK